MRVMGGCLDGQPGGLVQDQKLALQVQHPPLHYGSQLRLQPRRAGACSSSSSGPWWQTSCPSEI